MQQVEVVFHKMHNKQIPLVVLEVEVESSFIISAGLIQQYIRKMCKLLLTQREGKAQLLSPIISLDNVVQYGVLLVHQVFTDFSVSHV
jgi:hypothetical protein